MTEDDFDWLTVTFQGHSVNIQLTKWSSFILRYLALLIGPIFFVCQYIDHKLLTHTLYKIYKFYTWISWKYRKTIFTLWNMRVFPVSHTPSRRTPCLLLPLPFRRSTTKNKIKKTNILKHLHCKYSIKIKNNCEKYAWSLHSIHYYH